FPTGCNARFFLPVAAFFVLLTGSTRTLVPSFKRGDFANTTTPPLTVPRYVIMRTPIRFCAPMAARRRRRRKPPCATPVKHHGYDRRHARSVIRLLRHRIPPTSNPFQLPMVESRHAARDEWAALVRLATAVPRSDRPNLR